MKFKRVISSIVSCALLLTMLVGFMPGHAFASSIVAGDMGVTELISMARRAAQDGDLDKANKIEKIIEAQGVEVMTTQEVLEFAANNDVADSPQLDDIVKPPNSSAIHWYKETRYNYLYNGSRYDIISMTAVSWDDTNAWLHVDEQFVQNRNAKTVIQSAFSEAISVGVSNIPRLGCILSFYDIFEAIGKNASEYNELDIDKNAITCYWSADVDLTWHWIRKTSPNNDNSYKIRWVENRLEVNYGYIMRAQAVKPNGKVDTIITGKLPMTNNGSDVIVYENSTYKDLNKVCRVFDNDRPTEQNVGDLEFNLAGEIVTVPEITIPYYLG